NHAVFTSPPVNIDTHAPVVVASRTPAANANGWNNGPVTAHFVATDSLSGIDGPSTLDVPFSAEGRDQTARGRFSDRAGNVAAATVAGINIDSTAPEASLRADSATGHLAVFGIDALSGVPTGPAG